MKFRSCFAECSPSDHFRAWGDDIGQNLPIQIAKDLCAELSFTKITSSEYETPDFSDIAYCQLFSTPKKRPAKFIYTFISDYIGNEQKTKNWISHVRPNVLFCLQHLPEDLIYFGSQNECKVMLLPWFVANEEISNKKTITAMCSGCTDSRIYPSRSLMDNYLSSLNRNDIISSCSKNFGSYRLSNNEFKEAISKTKYYLSGGIYDRFVPPKYYEACNYGATLIIFNMETLKNCGFIHEENCIIIKNLKEINEIIDSDKYRTISVNAKKFVWEKHSLYKRSKQIIEVFKTLCN